MINVNDLKNGIAIIHDGQLYQVLEFQHVKPGKGSAFVRTKLKNLRAGNTIDHTFNSGIKVKDAYIDKATMSYLFDEGDTLAFMDMSSYEQISVPKKSLGNDINFLKENTECKVMSYEGEILGIELPTKVELNIVEAEPGIKGDTQGAATKKAKLETGANILVPLFVEAGETVIINTVSGEYVSRAK